MILGSLEEYGYYFLEARFRAGYVSRLIGRRGSFFFIYILLFWLYMYGLLQLIVCQDFNFV